MRIIYLCLLFECIFSETTTEETVKVTFEAENTNRGILQKEKSIEVFADEYMISFNCKDFDDGEEMYFKIKAEENAFYTYYGYNGIYYEYIDGDTPYEETALKFEEYQFKTDYETGPYQSYKIKYFTITKRKSEFRGTNGELLIIYFMIDHGKVVITNTLEDEGKFETWKIIVIVVVIVVVLAVIIGCYCYRRKKQLAAAVAVNQNNVQYNQPYTQTVPYSDPNQQYNQPVDNYGQQY